MDSIKMIPEHFSGKPEEESDFPPLIKINDVFSMSFFLIFQKTCFYLLHF